MSKQGVSIGSGIGSLEDLHTTSQTFTQHGYRKVPPLFVPRLLINLAAGHLAMRYSLRGPNFSPTTACTTGAHAISHAYSAIAEPDSPTNIMLAGAGESCIHPLALSGFARARSLVTDSNDSPWNASRPFDKSRAGFVIAEGAGVLILEELQHAKRRGANIYAELVGHGESCDAFHMTAPDENGRGEAQAPAPRDAGTTADRGAAAEGPHRSDASGPRGRPLEGARPRAAVAVVRTGPRRRSGRLLHRVRPNRIPGRDVRGSRGGGCRRVRPHRQTSRSLTL